MSKTKKFRFIIIGNGEIDHYNIFKKIIKKDDLIICVDGGTNHLMKTPFNPHYIIGDLDSLHGFRCRKPCQILKFSKDKNKTDTELAIDFALEFEPHEILLFGMLSNSRIDHSLNNIFLLERLVHLGVKATLIVNNFTQMNIVKDNIRIFRKNGKLISLIPLTNNVQHIETKGLKYPLKDETLYRFKTRGISNILVNKEAIITLRKGFLLVIQSKRI